MSKVECSQYESCLSNLNQSVINNLQEIREQALNVVTTPEGEEANEEELMQAPVDPDQINKNIKLMLS